MASHKTSRVQQDILHALSDIMRTVKDPRVQGLVSIVKLELAGDYSHCKIYISSMQGLESAKTAVQGLKSAAGYMRRELGGRVKMRRVPELHFVADDSIAHSAGIAKMLNDLGVHSAGTDDDGADGDEGAEVAADE